MSPHPSPVCRLALVLLGAVLIAAPISRAVADDGVPAAPPAAERTAPPWNIPITEETTAGEILHRVVAITGLPIVYDPQNKAVRGERIACEITLHGGAEDIIAQLRQLFFPNNLTIVHHGEGRASTYHVVDTRGGQVLQLRPEFASVTAENVARIEQQVGRFITTWIPVQHITDLRAARGALQRIVSQGNVGNVTEVPAASGFVVTDFAPNVAAIFRLLQGMEDQALAGRVQAGTTIMIEVKHARADLLAAQLTQHFAKDTPAAEEARARAPAPDVVTPRPLRITGDPRTNRLLVSGSKEDIEAVAAAVNLLDAAVPAQAAPAPAKETVVMIRLEHAKANEAAGALMNLYARRTTGRSTPGPRVVPDARTNSLLVAADDETLAAVRDLISLIDQPAPADGE